jgi:DNA-binding CsgD family transcriptional regulator
MASGAFEELSKIWSNITTAEDVKDTAFDVMAYKKVLDLFQVGDYFYVINNVRHSRFDLVSPEVEKVLGYNPEEFNLVLYSDLYHPEDLQHVLNFETAVEMFFRSISGERLFKYKMQYDFRLRHAKGNYVRVLLQYIIIQHDENNVRTFAIHTDISHLKKDNKSALSFIGIEGEPSYMNVDVDNVFRPKRPLLTSREREILRALSNGMSSNEISEALHISHYTVNSHRKNMLRKANAKSTSELISMAFSNGWI